MKKHKDFLYTLLGIGVIALLIFIVYKSKQPKPVQLDFAESPQTKEHDLVSEILADTESFAATEDAILEQVAQSPTYKNVPLPVAGAPLPVAWGSKPAPNLDEATLSPSLQRSLAASADLRTEEYTDSRSELNLARVEDIRSIRQNRHKAE